MTKLRSALMAALFVIGTFLALYYLPLTWFIVALILLIVLFVLVDAAGNRILFKMAIRNSARRKSATALVLAGLMVGTAIIASSLVVGDTLDNFIVGEVAKGFGEVDFFVGGTGDAHSGFYNSSEVAPLRDQVRNLTFVNGAEWYLVTTSSIKDLNNSLSSPSITVQGLTPNFVSGFGGLVAPDGSGITSMPIAGHAYVNGKLANALNIKQGDTLSLFHDLININLIAQIVVRDQNIGAMGNDDRIFIDLTTAQELRGLPNDVNTLAITLDPTGRANIDASRDQVNSTVNGTAFSAFKPLGLAIQSDRAQSIADGRSLVAPFLSLFLVFGSFSIIAGIALIINIFIMLGEERKSEMGVARAVGMQRTQLRKLFTYEGLVYAAVAALIGAFVGLILAYVIIMATGMVVNFGAPIQQYFTFTPLSLAAAYIAGFLLTMTTVYLVTWRISKLNIVRAIRNIPEPPRSRSDRGVLLLGLAILGFGLLDMLVGIVYKAYAPAMSGLSLMTISTGLILRRWTGDRLAWTIAGLATLFVWLPKGFQIFPYPSNIETFAIAGIFLVIASLIVVMFNSDPMVSFLTIILRVKGGYKAVIKTALSYPLRAKTRTALSIFIFALVIFTVTTLTMISGILAVGIPKEVNDSSGGFDVGAFSAFPVDLWGQINTTGGLVEKTNITNVVQLSIGLAMVTLKNNDGSDKRAPFSYSVIGTDTALYTEGNYPLTDWNRTLYPTQLDAWNAVRDNSSVVVVDGSAGATSPTGISLVGSDLQGVKIGDHLVLTDLSGKDQTMTVVGIMKQQVIKGVFASHQYVRNNLQIGGTNLFLIKLRGDLDPERQATLVQSQFWQYGMVAIPIKSVAQSAVDQITGILNLIEAFLALGLIIGITGLGIITIRSIHERRIEIGMMRALGYTKRMVVSNFALESAFVSVLGIVIGSLLGIVVGYQLWQTGFQSMDMDFVIAWEQIVLVGFLAFLATLLSVIPAARGASRVSPADVLRFE
jgi:putative ABC transport system permease protein